MKINLIGQIYGSSGYSNHTRGLINALYDLFEVKLSTPLPPNWERETNDKELVMIKRKDSKDHINLIIDLPFNWKQHCNKNINIGFLVFEGDKIPLSWVEYIGYPQITQVWVPSTHTYLAIKNTLNGENYKNQMLMNKVKIVPHGVNLELFKPEEKGNRPFTFLINKGFRNEWDRGGMQHGIRAFLEEFNKGEARLILKLNPAYAMHPNDLINYINKICKELNKPVDITPDIIFNYEYLQYDSLKEVYNNSDVLLNPTEAEAFSLPCIEAMACGKPVITTDYGGQTDFVTNSNGWLIPGQMHEVKHELMYEGISWYKPNILELRKAMREALSNKELYATKARNALKAASNFTWVNSALKAQEYLSQQGGESADQS